jgi:hypothetical protein
MSEKIDLMKRPDYKGFTLEQCATRPNSLDILKNPSRIDNSLFYPDGRIEYVTPTTKSN